MEGRSNASLGHQNFNTCLADPRRQESDKKVAEEKKWIKNISFSGDRNRAAEEKWGLFPLSEVLASCAD